MGEGDGNEDGTISDTKPSLRGRSLLPMEGGAPKGRRLDGESGISAPKPSPRGKGAPKGRIGQERYEKERGNASQVDDIRERPIHRYAVPLPLVGNIASEGSLLSGEKMFQFLRQSKIFQGG